MTPRGRVLAALALALLVAGCAGGDVAGTVGRVIAAAPQIRGAVVDLEEGEEIELGRAVSAAIGGRYPLLRDPALTRYVALVGNAVAARSERPDVRYYFAVLDTDEANAFAAPGGFVFITRGALALMRDEAMLAGVLGHEIAHVALRHHNKTIKAEKRKAVAMLGVQEGLARTGAAPFAQMITAVADQVAEQVILKGFSRAEESEADGAGVRYATAAGYDPAGLRDFLRVLHAQAPIGQGVSAFFSTHPGTDERLEEQDAGLERQPAGGRRAAERFERAMGRRAPAAGPGRQAPRATVAATPPVERAESPAPPPTAPVPPARVPAGPETELAQALRTTGRVVVRGIEFEVNSDRLRPESRAAVREIAALLAASPGLRLVIEGHTDSTGRPALNLELSRRRAEAVKQALVSEHGIAAERLATAGHGPDRPIAPNDTPEGRAANRRVELVNPGIVPATPVSAPRP